MDLLPFVTADLLKLHYGCVLVFFFVSTFLLFASIIRSNYLFITWTKKHSPPSSEEECSSGSTTIGVIQRYYSACLFLLALSEISADHVSTLLSVRQSISLLYIFQQYLYEGFSGHQNKHSGSSLIVAGNCTKDNLTQITPNFHYFAAVSLRPKYKQ